MAEPTIQLGGGNWAGKTDNLLGYYKEGERFYKQDFTFSRSTTGTYTDSDGYIQEMPYNLSTNSQPTSGVGFQTGVVFQQTDIYDWNGVYYGDNTVRRIAFFPNTTIVGQTYTFSIFVKLTDGSTPSVGNSATDDFRMFNGTATTDSLTITDLGNGIFRCSVVRTATSTTTNVAIEKQTYNSAKTFEVSGYQVNKGTSAKTYFPTTTRLNMPRVDYLNNSNGSLILEPQRSNLLNYSSDFSQSYYTKSQVTITSNDTTSPDGTQNSDKVVETTNNSEHFFYRAGISTLGTISIYAKADNSGRLFQIRRDAGAGTNSWAWFNLDNGTVESEDAGVASIESLSNNWYRCIFTPTNASGTIVFSISNGATTRSVSYEGNGTSGVYIYGAMLEAGSYPTSLINTSGSSVTRNADTCSISNVADRINSSEGTLFVEISAFSGANTDRQISISDGGTSNRVVMALLSNGTQIQFVVVSGGSVTVNTTQTITTITSGTKIAFAYKANDFKIYANGLLIASDTSGAVPIGLDTLGFDRGDGNDVFYGNVKNLQLYKTRLSNSELATLTTL